MISISPRFALRNERRAFDEGADRLGRFQLIFRVLQSRREALDLAPVYLRHIWINIREWIAGACHFIAQRVLLYLKLP